MLRNQAEELVRLHIAALKARLQGDSPEARQAERDFQDYVDALVL